MCQFLTWENENPFPSSKKWWSEQLSITSNCFNWSELLLSKETGKSFLSWVSITSQYGVMPSEDCSLLTKCESVSGSQVFKSFLSRQLDSFPSSNLGIGENFPESDATDSVLSMLALMVEKSSKAAWGRDEELLSPGCFSQFSLSPLQSNNVCHQNDIQLMTRKSMTNSTTVYSFNNYSHYNLILTSLKVLFYFLLLLATWLFTTISKMRIMYFNVPTNNPHKY